MAGRIQVRYHRSVEHAEPVVAHLAVEPPRVGHGVAQLQAAQRRREHTRPAEKPAYTRASSAKAATIASSKPLRVIVIRSTNTLPPRTQTKPASASAARTESASCSRRSKPCPLHLEVVAAPPELNLHAVVDHPTAITPCRAPRSRARLRDS